MADFWSAVSVPEAGIGWGTSFLCPDSFVKDTIQ